MRAVKIRRSNGINAVFLSGKMKLGLGLLLLALLLVAAWSVYSYFSGSRGVLANQVRTATLDLELTNNSGGTLVPLDLSDIYPGWSYDWEGQVRNIGSADLIFRLQLENSNDDFLELARTMDYILEVENAAGVGVYSEQGRLAELNEDNQLMNILIQPNQLFYYCLSFHIPEDMDDYTTSENEEDDIYQGKEAKFDLMVQSTQANNTTWGAGGGSPQPQ